MFWVVRIWVCSLVFEGEVVSRQVKRDSFVGSTFTGLLGGMIFGFVVGFLVLYLGRFQGPNPKSKGSGVVTVTEIKIVS